MNKRFPSNILYALMTAVVLILVVGSQPAAAQVTAFKQSLAVEASKDRDLAAFYRANGFEAIWTGSGNKDKARRKALLSALDEAGAHGLPAGTYGLDALEAQLRSARTAADRAAVEVAMSSVFLDYARDVQTGVTEPSRVDSGIERAAPLRNRGSYLPSFVKSSPRGFMKALPPGTDEYAGLMKEKERLERVLGKGGWGPTVRAKSVKPGQSGDAVVSLRNRLVAMGYIRRSASKSYDFNLQKAVQRFQKAHGLSPDGVAGPGTLTEINQPAEARLQSVIVAMERERWMNMPRGKRHIEVNLTDFSAKIIDNGRVTFETRSVVGKNRSDHRSPEFSDVMEFMVVNPSWHVPRSIVTKEYLPKLQQNPNAAQYLVITDRKGRRVNRQEVDFAAYSARNFPYTLRQPPSDSNALGLVKFMFPNPHNIYLHDTPHKNLFSREVRAFSHGCIRLADPFDFAYALLARQTKDPEGYFKSVLSTGKETQVMLKEPVPIHIMYRTAVISPKGEVRYRRDIYGRDAKVWSALSQAGVALRAVQG